MKKRFGITSHLKKLYVQKVKGWIICPACQCGKMIFDNTNNIWACKNCSHHFLAKDFEKNQVHWFCEECNRYLNTQEGFDWDKDKHICQNCGYENDISLNTVKGVCTDCGDILANPEKTLCPICKKIRRQKAKERLLTAGKIVGAAAALIAGAAYAVGAIKAELEANNFSDNKPEIEADNDKDKFKSSANDEIIEQDWEEDDNSEKLSSDDAALIWLCNGMDEEYMFGYSEEELKNSL